MSLFDRWLEATKTLQEEAYRLDYDHFAASDEDADDKIVNLVDYIGVNVTAAVHELVELQSETSWKPWQHDHPYANREQIKGEAVDVLHFIANILTSIGVTDQELNRAYTKKMEVNRERQLGPAGYHVLAAGVKCRECKRALDDVAASHGDPTICIACATTEVSSV